MIPAVQNSPIHLCSILTDDLDSKITSHNVKGTLYRVAAIVSAIVLVAIFGAMSAVYLALLATPPTWTLLVSLCVALAATKGLGFWKMGGAEFTQRAQLKEITQKLDEISNWTTPQVQLYFTNNNLEDQLETLEDNASLMALLEEKSPGAPLKALLPLIARELLLASETTNLERLASEHIGGIEDVETEVEGGESVITQEEVGFNKFKQHPELESRYFSKGVESREELCFTLMRRAILLQNLTMPDRNFDFDGAAQLWDIDHQENGPIGKCEMKGSESRAIEYSSLALTGIDRPRNFYISANEEKAPLTTDQLALLSPREIRPLVFD
jgi:hypothetical protein